MATSKVNWTAGMISDRGRNPRRELNEDCLGSFVPEDEAQLTSRGALYLVADGIGGQNAGEVASQMARDVTLEGYYKAAAEMDNIASLRQAIERANSLIHERSKKSAAESDMGTTIVAAAIRPDGELLVANVGDSRAYLVHNGAIVKLSRDHTWVAEQVEAGLLKPEEARAHRRRHQLTRSLGPRPKTEVDFSTHRLSPGDVVVLCSDGLFDVVEEHEIAEAVRAMEPQAAAEALMQLANQRGGPDNITVIVLRYKEARAARRAVWPIVAAAMGAVILLAGGVFAAVVLLRPMATPTPTKPALVAAQATPTPTAAQPTPTSADALAPAPTTTPTPLPTATAPAGTRAPTSTLYVSPTPQPTSTLKPTQARKGDILGSRLTLKEPVNGQWVEFGKPVKLVWTFSRSLLLGEEFEVRIWWRQDDGGNGAALSTFRTAKDSFDYPNRNLPDNGKYFNWTVVVLIGNVEVAKAEPDYFGYTKPPDNGGGGGGPIQPTPVNTPSK